MNGRINNNDEKVKMIIPFVMERKNEIVSEIANVFDNNISSYDYVHFCEDGNFVISDVYQEDNDVFCVVAEGNVHEGRIIITQDGPWPNDDCSKVMFTFYVNVDGDGKMKLIFITDEDGKIDMDRTFINTDNDI